LPEDFQVDSFTSNTEKDHGRITTWTSHAIAVDHDWIPNAIAWPGLKTIIRVKTHTESGPNFQKITDETRYYICSIEITAEKAWILTRKHWMVEILHYTLDTVFREDECRIRARNGAEVFSAFRKLAFNMIRNTKGKMSMRTAMDDFMVQPERWWSLFGFNSEDTEMPNHLVEAA
jgi:predicted transposase YbfD/YdcC